MKRSQQPEKAAKSQSKRPNQSKSPNQSKNLKQGMPSRHLARPGNVRSAELYFHQGNML